MMRENTTLSKGWQETYQSLCPGGSSRAMTQSREKHRLKPDLCVFVYPKSYWRLGQLHLDCKIQTDCTSEPLARHHSSSTPLHKGFEIQPLLNRAFGSKYHAGHQRVSSSSEGQRDKTQVVGQLHPQLMEIISFVSNRATSVYHRWRSAALLSQYTCLIQAHIRKHFTKITNRLCIHGVTSGTVFCQLQQSNFLFYFNIL